MSEEEKKSRTSWYTNTSKTNLFTEQGKVPPGRKVFMSPQKAKNYSQLTLAKK